MRRRSWPPAFRLRRRVGPHQCGPSSAWRHGACGRARVVPCGSHTPTRPSQGRSCKDIAESLRDCLLKTECMKRPGVTMKDCMDQEQAPECQVRASARRSRRAICAAGRRARVRCWCSHEYNDASLFRRRRFRRCSGIRISNASEGSWTCAQGFVVRRRTRPRKSELVDQSSAHHFHSDYDVDHGDAGSPWWVGVQCRRASDFTWRWRGEAPCPGLAADAGEAPCWRST